jgi:hypothetical protein
LTFAEDLLGARSLGQIRHLIFSDESWFCGGPDNFWVRVRGELGENCHFMQDGAPCHPAAATMEALQLMRVPPIWAQNSPDLNPIEML